MSHRSVTIPPPRPAGGHDWTFVPSESDWSRLVSITGLLVTIGDGDNRSVALTVTDQDGLVIAADIPPVGQTSGVGVRYSWRPQAMDYGEGAGVASGSCPGFWLPAGSTVAAATTNLQGTSAVTQATGNTGDQSANLPVTIVAGANDRFTWLHEAYPNGREDFTIAAGAKATTAAVAAALAAAIGQHGEAFSTKATVADDGSGGYTFTAVSSSGVDGNGDGLESAEADDAWATIVTDGTPLPLTGGAGSATGDQWSEVVATYIVADDEHWRAVEALLDQVAPGAR